MMFTKMKQDQNGRRTKMIKCPYLVPLWPGRQYWPWGFRLKLFLWLFPCLTLIGSPGLANSGAKDLTNLSLEDLMQVSVTSVSKKEEKISDAPAAIFVITQEDIRRSGVTNIPDALRMVPGVEVARIDSNKWAISARGFNSRFANKLLVLMDGRTLYSNLFSGVWWDVQDTFIEDIDRIEVIRGPGATLWGANAVNGVINIITKKAKDTQGGLAVAGGGSFEKAFGGVRYGLQTGENTNFRAYAKGFYRDGTVYQNGDRAADDWDSFRTGFRLDHDPTVKNSFTFQGDFYQGRIGSPYALPSLSPPYSIDYNDNSNISGGNILGRWKHTFSQSSDLSLQIYYDRTHRKDVVISEDQDTVDIDLQHRFRWIGGQEIIWGLGYRAIRDQMDRSPYLALNPGTRNDQLFSAFVQDDITLIQDRLRWIIGCKFEHNDYTGYEYQPNTRLIWTPNSNHSIWGAVSRSVRTPSRVDQQLQANYATIPPFDAQNPTPFPVSVQVFGNSNFTSEELIAYELGYRFQPISRLTFDLAGFYNSYGNLRLSTTGSPIMVMNSSSPYLILPLSVANGDSAETYGVELAVDWKPLEWWRLKAAYTWMQFQYHSKYHNNALSNENFGVPMNQVSLRSQINLGKNVEFDAWLRYVDNLLTSGIPSYLTLDLKIAWRPLKNLELAVIGQNLLEPSHAEFPSEFFNTRTQEIPRSIYGKITWKF
jgi:iron complex outermembrane recepter protein